jgi:IS30 family transposase
VATRRYSTARSKPQTQGEELKALDKLVAPLIRKGQPLAHICSEHKAELPISERTLYRYIESGILTIGNLDLRRKVGYRPRKKKKKAPTEGEKNREYRKNRTYADFVEYLQKHPNTNYVEMDTVVGKQGKGKRMLTMLFVKQSLMLIFLLRDGKADTVVDIFDWLTSALGIKIFRSLFPVILTDNGSEFKRSYEMEHTIEGTLRTKVFYCDPQQTNQKSRCERNHEFIRYILPKGSCFDDLTQDDVTLMMNHINSLPRASLNAKSPYKAFVALYGKETAAKLGLKYIPLKELCLKPELLRK